MLQTRNGKRTARAAVKIAVDMANERLIDRTIHLEQTAQMVGTSQSIDDRVGQRSRDAGLALHFMPRSKPRGQCASPSR
jgi:hypothetical protein